MSDIMKYKCEAYPPSRRADRLHKMVTKALPEEYILI
jgi:hypothetical protein